MMYDVTFISPPKPYLVNAAAQAPLGLMYLASACESAGMSVRIANLAGVGSPQWSGRIPRSRAYGITGTFLDVPTVNELIEWISFNEPQARILVGGPISLSADQLDPRAHVVHGEADLHIVDILQMNAPVLECPEPDIKALRAPARHLWPGPFGGNIFLGGKNWFGGGSTTLMTQRGCPMSCAFCAGPALCSRKIRQRPASAVVSEMEQCATEFGVRQFRLSDEYFTAQPSHVYEICDRIMSSKVLDHGKGVAWRASVAVKPCIPFMFKAMVEAGCKEVSIGVESADPAVLRMICSGKTTPSDALECLKACREAGLKTRALMMIGTPGSRPETEALTTEFFETDAFDGLAVTVFQPIPGSDIASHPEFYSCRLLKDPQSLCLYGPDGANDLDPSIEVDGMTREQLKAQICALVAAAEATGKLGSG